MTATAQGVWILAVIAAAAGCSKKSDSGPAPTAPLGPDDAATAHAPPERFDASPPMSPGERLLAAELAAYKSAKPVFEEYCAHCHTTGDKPPSKKRKKALEHFTMDRYPFGGHHAAELGKTIREVLGVGGGEAKMPKDDVGAVEGEELDTIVKWSRAFDEARAAGVGHHADARQLHDHGAPR